MRSSFGNSVLLKQDVFGLKSRVANLEEENKSMQMMMNFWNEYPIKASIDHDNATHGAKNCTNSRTRTVFAFGRDVGLAKDEFRRYH